MGRELRRVPLDFNWPLNKVWEGFINPHWKPCPATVTNPRTCLNGYNSAGKWLEAISRLIAMVGQEAFVEPQAEQLKARGRVFPHPYLQSWGEAPREDIPFELERIADPVARRQALGHWMAEMSRNSGPPLLPFGEELVQLVQGLSGDKDLGPLVGGGLAYNIMQTLLKAAKIPKKEQKMWGTCRVCKGTGTDPAAQKAFDKWKPTEPPTGPGYQLWETVSEGSPISPVFPTAETFIAYLKDQGYSETAATAFVKTGWAPSGMMVGGKMYENIEALAK